MMNAQNDRYDYPTTGCYVDESCGSADDCNTRAIEFAQEYGFVPQDMPEEDSEDYSEIIGEIADDAVDYLNSLEHRTAMFWTLDDNSLFLVADVDDARECVDFISHEDGCRCGHCSADDPAYPADDYRGEWLHVNDHGNATLYNRTDDGDEEIWAVV